MTLRKFKNISNCILMPIGLAGLIVGFLTKNSDEVIFKLSVLVFIIMLITARYLKFKYCYCQNCSEYIGNKFGAHCKHCGSKIDLDKEINF